MARGLGGVWEARQIEGLIAWMQRYERALAWVAVHGDRDSAMMARRVLAGDWDDAWGLSLCLLLCEIVVRCEQVNQLARSRP